MRQFLTGDTPSSSRVFDRETSINYNSSAEKCTTFKRSSSNASLARGLSRARSLSCWDASPPATPIKSEPSESSVPLRHFDSMEMVLDRQRRKRKEQRRRRDTEQDESADAHAALPIPQSPTPSNASKSSHSVKSTSKSRANQSYKDETTLITVVQVC